MGIKIDFPAKQLVFLLSLFSIHKLWTRATKILMKWGRKFTFSFDWHFFTIVNRNIHQNIHSLCVNWWSSTSFLKFQLPNIFHPQRLIYCLRSILKIWNLSFSSTTQQIASSKSTLIQQLISFSLKDFQLNVYLINNKFIHFPCN